MVKRELMYKFNRHSNWLFKETHFIFKIRIVLANSNLQNFKLLSKTLWQIFKFCFYFSSNVFITPWYIYWNWILKPYKYPISISSNHIAAITVIHENIHPYSFLIYNNSTISMELNLHLIYSLKPIISIRQEFKGQKYLSFRFQPKLWAKKYKTKSRHSQKCSTYPIRKNSTKASVSTSRVTNNKFKQWSNSEVLCWKI